MLVDSHCHLDFPEFAPELDAVVARAKAAGVGLCVTIRVAEQLTTLDPLCQVKSPCPRHLPDRGRAGRVTPPAG